MPDMQETETPFDEDLVAAALAAVRCYISEEQRDDMPDTPVRLAWSAAAVLIAQGQAPSRGAQARWGTVDRVGRAGRWSYGIVGL